MEKFECRRTLYLHQMNQHPQIGAGNLQPRLWMDGSAPWEEGGRTDGNLKTVYEANFSLILRRLQLGNVCRINNFPINNNFPVSEIMQAANEIYDRPNRAFPLNLEFGFIMINSTDILSLIIIKKFSRVLFTFPAENIRIACSYACEN